MRLTIVLLAIAVAVAASSSAGPRKVLVLPLDGTAPAAQRSKLNASLVTLTKKHAAGTVTIGDTTFAETASAVGCDPASPACAETVRSTLAVDELIYGSANKAGSSTTVVVHRVSKGSPPKSETTTIAATDPAEKAEPALEPLFAGAEGSTGSGAGPGSEGSGSEGSGSGSGLGSGSEAEQTTRPRPATGIPFLDTRERKIGTALGAASLVAIVVGITFWVGKADLQDQIDTHSTRTRADFAALEDLEGRAATKALVGNIVFGVGVALAGASAYYFYKDHGNREATVTPAPVETGTGLSLVYGGRW